MNPVKKSSVRRICDEPSKWPDMKSGRKPASGIPKAVLQEPKSDCQEPVKGTQQLLKFFFRAADGDLLGFPTVQGEKAHEGGGVDREPVAAHNEPELLLGSQCHKIHNIPKRPESDIEFVHFSSPRRYTKLFLSCIMGDESKPDSM
jgi:hypothetical protein